MKSTTHSLIKTICALSLVVSGGSSCLYAEEHKSNEASISNPGPDLANFPNSAFTLPQGRAYVELAPFNYSRRSASGSPTQWNAGYLLRYGLTNDFELRLLSDGYTSQRGPDGASGMSPQTFDFKWHVSDENKDSHLPAFGIEVAVQTDLASRGLRERTQPALSLNFDQTLPLDIAFEYNIGVFTQDSEDGKRQAQGAFSWALQKEVVTDVAFFVNGYTNTGEGHPESAVGAGLQWTPTSRLALFTNLSGGLTQATSKFSALFGFAVAF
jgi:hypothetical protein